MNYEKAKEVVKDHEAEINEGDFERVILDSYLRYDVEGLTEIKSLFLNSDLGEPYRKAVKKIIKNLLQTSAILDD